MSAADLSTKRGHLHVQLENKQRQGSATVRAKQEASSPGWITPRSKKTKDGSSRNVNRPVSAPSVAGRLQALSGPSEQRPSLGKGPSSKPGNIGVNLINKDHLFTC